MGIGEAYKTIDILLVDDNPADVRIIMEVFRECRLSCRLHALEDGADALELLQSEGRHVNTPLPDIIMLDLNMPKIDGFRVLSEIKSDSDLRTIPVFVLSTSSADKDIRGT